MNIPHPTIADAPGEGSAVRSCATPGPAPGNAAHPSPESVPRCPVAPAVAPVAAAAPLARLVRHAPLDAPRPADAAWTARTARSALRASRGRPIVGGFCTPCRRFGPAPYRRCVVVCGRRLGCVVVCGRFIGCVVCGRRGAPPAGPRRVRRPRVTPDPTDLPTSTPSGAQATRRTMI